MTIPQAFSCQSSQLDSEHSDIDVQNGQIYGANKATCCLDETDSLSSRHLSSFLV